MSSIQGPRGPQGVKGLRGDRGLTGEPGPAGGPVGPSGPQGIPGSQWFAAAGVPNNGTGVNGDDYLNTTNGDVYKKAAGAWGAPVGNIKGPQGTQGIQGIQGIQGDPGQDGQDGADGINGDDGAAGQAAFTTSSGGFTVPAIGATNPLGGINFDWTGIDQIIYLAGAGYLQITAFNNPQQAVAKNLGYPGNAVQGTVIGNGAKITPAGLQGPQGAQGIQGIQGDPGADGAPGGGSSVEPIQIPILSNAWVVDGGALPDVSPTNMVLVIGPTIYLFGAGANFDKIFSAPVSNPATWTDTGAVLATPTWRGALYVIGTKIYIAGGENAIVFLDAIQSADLATPTVWANEVAVLPEVRGRIAGNVIVSGGFIYTFGGSGGTPAGEVISSVIMRAAVGAPTVFTHVGNFPSNLRDNPIVVNRGFAYVLSGIQANGLPTTIWKAPLSDLLTGWVAIGDLNYGTHIAALAIVNDTLYIMGGYGAPTRDYQFASLSDLTTWTTVANGLPYAIASAAAVIVAGSVWLFGGLGVAGLPGESTIERSNGSEMAWTMLSGDKTHGLPSNYQDGASVINSQYQQFGVQPWLFDSAGY